MGDPISVAASIITIAASACGIAKLITRTIQRAKHHNQNLEELEHSLQNLTAILGGASEVCRRESSEVSTPNRQLLLQSLRRIVGGCERILSEAEPKVEKLVNHGTWMSREIAAPDLERIGKSISKKQQELSSDRQIDTQTQIREIRDLLRDLTHQTAPESGIDLTSYQSPSTLIEEPESDTLAGEESEDNLEPSYDPSGVALLDAIENGDIDSFESLLQDLETSFQVKDSKDRNPLLLAAHLDKERIVSQLLADCTKPRNREAHTPGGPPGEATHSTSIPSPLENPTQEKASTDRRTIDLNATDSLGRTVLHYCAEFDMFEVAKTLIAHGVDVNLRDSSDFPPAYYAVKSRKYDVVKLLLNNGASTDFKRPPTTSDEIDKLLEHAADGQDQASSPGQAEAGDIRRVMTAQSSV
ncbi:MAG: hypothetical protein Q9202_004115 [Teloschistes flavicans]